MLKTIFVTLATLIISLSLITPCLCLPTSRSSTSLTADLRANPLKDVRDLTWMLVQEYSRFLLSIIETVQKIDYNIKRRTYTYGLEVVGRPINQLTPAEMLLSATLMPRKFYSEAASNFVKKVNTLQKTLHYGMEAVDKARKTSSTLYSILQTIPRTKQG